MNTNVMVKPAIEIAGVSVRTTNEQETGPNGQLSMLWNTYFQSGIAERIQASNPHLIYALYTHYESDASGAYTVILGHEMGDQHNPQALEGLAHTVIPEAQYMIFRTKRGPVFEVVAGAWQQIWSFFEDSSVERTYSGDFELYDSREFDPNDAEIDIYIAIK